MKIGRCEDGGLLCPKCMEEEAALIAVAERDNDKQWNVIETFSPEELDEELDCDPEGPTACDHCYTALMDFRKGE